jgi:hypothetical protein
MHRDFEIEIVFIENPFLDADIENGINPQNIDGFADMQPVGGMRGRRREQEGGDQRNNNAVIASEAKQSRVTARSWIASSLRSSQ